jgi:hypothetical protein
MKYQNTVHYMMVWIDKPGALTSNYWGSVVRVRLSTNSFSFAVDLNKGRPGEEQVVEEHEKKFGNGG